MTNPLPDCGRTEPGGCGTGFVSSNGTVSGARRRRVPERVVASILTTAGFRLSATSAKFTSPTGATGTIVAVAGAAVARVGAIGSPSAGGGGGARNPSGCAPGATPGGAGARKLPDVTPSRNA